MTSHDAAVHDGGTDRRACPLPFDTSVAHQARMYDYMLGGKDNYAADRAAVEATLKVYPDAAFTARANRAFLGRVVRYLAAEAGIRQFLDIGTGIPTAGNTHEVAQAVAPESRVVYVDYDPVVLAHARALLTSNEAGATEYIDADLRDTAAILAQACEAAGLHQAGSGHAALRPARDAGLRRPARDRGQAAWTPCLPAATSPSHTGRRTSSAGKPRTRLQDIGSRMVQQSLALRNREQVAQFFAGTDLVAPGLVRVEEWRPEPGTGDTGRSSLWCAVGCKR